MTKQTVLITGANGFVGYALWCALLQSEKYILFAPKSSELDLMNTSSVDNFFKENRIDLVYHLAAKHAGVGSGVNRPLYFLESNLLMGYNVVSAAIKHHVKKFVTLGSSCTYQIDLSHPAEEEDLWDQRAENTYGTCKQLLLEHLQAQDTMKWAYFIPPNLYGPGDHFGEDGAHFIPATVKKFQAAVENNTREITVWGDGTQTRDFLYLQDVIAILLEASSTDKYDGRPINIATGRQIAIHYVVELIQKNMRLGNIAINWDSGKPTGLQKRELNNALFLSLNPDFQFVQIEAGIQKTMEWYLHGADREDILCYIK